MLVSFMYRIHTAHVHMLTHRVSTFAPPPTHTYAHAGCRGAVRHV